jgi:hypothetical protein
VLPIKGVINIDVGVFSGKVAPGECVLINNELNIDNTNDSLFIFHENGQSEQDLKTYDESSHIKECFDVIREVLDSAEM